MGCTLTLTHVSSDGTNGGAAPEPDAGDGHTGPYLIVSNCPETITDDFDGAIVLYRAEIPLSSATTYRIFLWHLNETGDTKTFRIRLKVTSGTLTISSRKYSDDVISANGDLLALGRELACVYNYGNFDNVPAGTQTITTSFGPLWSADADDGQLVACVFEFSHGAVGNDVSLIIQTSCDTGTPAGDDAPVAAPVNAQGGHVHIRGWWPHSEILFPVDGFLECNPLDPGDPIICGVVEKTDGTPPPLGQMPPELAATALGWRGATVDQYGTNQGNKGLYGATVKYEFQAINSNTTLDGSMNLDIRMRNTGTTAVPGKFSGVGGTIAPSGSMRHIPVLRSNTNPKFSSFDSGADMSIGPNTTTNNPKTVICELSPAGAATLPVNLVFSAGTIT